MLWWVASDHSNNEIVANCRERSQVMRQKFIHNLRGGVYVGGGDTEGIQNKRLL